MTPERIRAIRKAAGLSIRDMASVLRMKDERTVRRWEHGDVPISGPASILLEMMEAGTWRPEKPLDTTL